jgi:hypothetical protein
MISAILISEASLLASIALRCLKFPVCSEKFPVCFEKISHQA